MRSRHFETCEAPICRHDIEPELMLDRVWYPGEPVCGIVPLVHWQKIQRRINRLHAAGRLKYPDLYFTGHMLDGIQSVRSGIMGLNPNPYINSGKFVGSTDGAP